MSQYKPIISIVIVIGPSRLSKSLIRCLDSVYRSNYKNFEVILMDNSRNKHLKEKVRARFPTAIYITLPKNEGIYAYNVGYLQARGEYILSLDDDSEIEKDTLKKIIGYFNNAKKRTLIISCNTVNPLIEKYYYKHWVDMNLIDVLTFVGGACVFRKSVISIIGLYDESFFCWVHEDDYAARVIKNGYTIEFASSIRIIHHDEVGANSYFKVFHIFRNKAWFNIRYFPFYMLPILFIKDILWIFSLSTIMKEWRVCIPFITGSVVGYVMFFTQIRKRNVFDRKYQKRYVTYYRKLLFYVLSPYAPQFLRRRLYKISS